jgi:hypothetical protein
MDAGNDKPTTAGIGGLTFNIDGSGDKSTGSDFDIAGRIDPVIARATSGDSSTGGPSGASGGSAGSAPDSGTTRRRRGRPSNAERGISDNDTGKASTPRNIRASFIEKTLYSIHLGIASITQIPEFKLDDDDAKELGTAVAGVLAFYKVTMTPKQEAYSLLLEAAVKVYGPMGATYFLRKKIEAEQARKNAPPRPQQQARPQAQPAREPGPVVVPMPTKVPGQGPTFDPAHIHLPDGAS